MQFNAVTNDFVQIEYRDGDRLYVPVDRLNLISRYEGLSDQIPKIDKLGTQTWKTTTTKVKEEVWKVAQELLEIYATRELREGRQFSPRPNCSTNWRSPSPSMRPRVRTRRSPRSSTI